MGTAQMPWPGDHRRHRFSRHDLLNVLSFLLPPLVVKLAGANRGIALNILLTLCGWIPGVIHARRVLARDRHLDVEAAQLVNALRNHVRR